MVIQNSLCPSVDVCALSYQLPFFCSNSILICSQVACTFIHRDPVGTRESLVACAKRPCRRCEEGSTSADFPKPRDRLRRRRDNRHDGPHHGARRENHEWRLVPGLFQGRRPSTDRDRVHGLGNSEPFRQLLLRLLDLLPRTSRPRPFNILRLCSRPVRNQHGRCLWGLVPHDVRHRQTLFISLWALRPLFHASCARLPRSRPGSSQERSLSRHRLDHVGLGSMLPTHSGHCLLFLGRRTFHSSVTDQDSRPGPQPVQHRRHHLLRLDAVHAESR